MDKAARRIRTVSMGFLISGILSILIGAYYLFVKAGIPYQDPPLKLQIQYANKRISLVKELRYQ